MAEWATWSPGDVEKWPPILEQHQTGSAGHLVPQAYKGLGAALFRKAPHWWGPTDPRALRVAIFAELSMDVLRANLAGPSWRSVAIVAFL